MVSDVLMLGRFKVVNYPSHWPPFAGSPTPKKILDQRHNLADDLTHYATFSRDLETAFSSYQTTSPR